MRITIEIPDDQVPPYYFNKLYPSGYNEDNLHHLLTESAVLHKLHMLRLLASSKDDIPDDIDDYEQLADSDINFLKLLQQNMKIESGDSKEKVLIDGLTEVAKDWYDGCPKSMKFVTRVLQLLKSYNGN